MQDSTFFMAPATDDVISDEAILPIDSAFIGGQKHLDSFEVCSDTGYYQYEKNSTAITDILTMVFIILGIASLNKFINLVPSLVGCIIRWKENINLEDSTKLCLSRNSLFILLLIPFCLVIEHLKLYNPGILSGLATPYHFLATTCIFICYLFIRTLLNRFVNFGKISKKNFTAAANSFRTYFVITATLVLATSGISELADIPDLYTKKIVFYEIIAVYGLLLLRKTQIFTNFCSLIAGILYLCTLEILPTGILIASAIVL